MRLLVVALSSLTIVLATSWSASAQSCQAKCNAYCTKNYPHSNYCLNKCVENCSRRNAR